MVSKEPNFIDDQKKTSGVKNLNFPNGLLTEPLCSKTRKNVRFLASHGVLSQRAKINSFYNFVERASEQSAEI